MHDHEKFMQMAIELSMHNLNGEAGGPFGAVITRDGVVIGASANKVIEQGDPTAHAEISAIRIACKNLNTHLLEGCTIYTSCEPCPMCLGAIYWAHIDTIYYANDKVDAANIGFDDHFIYKEIERPMDERKLPIIRILREEALHVFNTWDKFQRKIDY